MILVNFPSESTYILRFGVGRLYTLNCILSSVVNPSSAHLGSIVVLTKEERWQRTALVAFVWYDDVDKLKYGERLVPEKREAQSVSILVCRPASVEGLMARFCLRTNFW